MSLLKVISFMIKGESLLHNRMFHSSAVTSAGLHLIGGSISAKSTELLPSDGGSSLNGFVLDVPRRNHCSIQISNASIVLTGGEDSLFSVTEISGLSSGDELVRRKLPDLISKRSDHACGSYWVEDSQASQSIF